ncbi:MAG TPA: flagellar basal body-associated FliL family protein [Gemmatimonadales bacterium]|jgi:flagellar basal body-associated protein FliL
MRAALVQALPLHRLTHCRRDDISAPTVQETQAPSAAPAAAAAPTKTIILAIAALMVGSAIGAFVVAPRFRAGAAASTPAADHGKKQDTEPPRMVKIDNVIVNPAGTQGQHYLIVSVAIEVSTAEAEARLHREEIPLRDAVTGLLERMTLDRLTQLGARDTLRGQIARTAVAFAGDSALKVYLPQFLIQ